MIEILPAIMPDSYVDLEAKAAKVKGLVPFVQIDIMDGAFVLSRSWPYREDGTIETISLPFRDTLRYEVDLMVATPAEAARMWIEAGAARVLFHIESTEDPLCLIEDLSAEYGASATKGILEIGVAIDIATPNDRLEPILHEVGTVQFMGIAKIGYQGEPFDERVLGKIRELRGKHPETIISVDGGVNFETASRLLHAGAKRLVAGSAIYTAENIAEAIKKLQNM